MEDPNELWWAEDTPEVFEQDTREEEEHIFSEVMRQPANGFKMVDVGWASISIREHHGIEPLVGLPLGASLTQFHDWVCSVTGSQLLDWEPVEISLHRCAYTQMEPHGATGSGARRLPTMRFTRRKLRSLHCATKPGRSVTNTLWVSSGAQFNEATPQRCGRNSIWTSQSRRASFIERLTQVTGRAGYQTETKRWRPSTGPP